MHKRQGASPWRQSAIQGLAPLATRFPPSGVIPQIAILLALILGLPSHLFAETRARPPEFTAEELSLFPENPRELLVGPRPDFGTRATTTTPLATGGPSTDDENPQWSQWISADAVETEIKRQVNRLAQHVKSPTSFKGGGYRDCRDALSLLAILFRVAGEHDEGARWKRIAPAVAPLIARAGANCKVGTDGSFREAALRSEELSQLIRGGRPDFEEPTEETAWGDLADRSPLMRWMEGALEKRLKDVLSSERQFGRSPEDAQQDAEVLAVLGEVLTREGFDDSDDATYQGYARALRDASVQLTGAASEENYDQAQSAESAIGKSCSACHADYRG